MINWFKTRLELCAMVRQQCKEIQKLLALTAVKDRQIKLLRERIAKYEGQANATKSANKY